MLDAITMERHGIPAAMVGTEVLIKSTGRGMARLQNMPDFPLAQIDGLGQLDVIRDAAEMKGLVENVMPRVASILLTGKAES